MDYEVPQGSVLGALLFLVYMNDVSTATSPHKTITFDDDTAIIIREKDEMALYDSATKCMSSLGVWMLQNGLLLNIKKTKCMRFSLMSRPVALSQRVTMHALGCNEILCNYPTLENVDCYRYLGLCIQSNLKSDQHIIEVKTKIRKGTAVLARLRGIFPMKVREQVYGALIDSHLNYMLAVYGGTYRTAIDPLIGLQRQAVRLINSSQTVSSTVSMFQNDRTLPLKKALQLSTCRMLYFESTNLTRPLHRYNTRQVAADNIEIPRNKKTATEPMATERFIKIYNGLPPDMKELFN